MSKKKDPATGTATGTDTAGAASAAGGEVSSWAYAAADTTCVMHNGITTRQLILPPFSKK